MKPIKSKQNNSKNYKIAIVTDCVDDWGGCEELWAKSIPFLQKQDFEIMVLKGRINRLHPEYIALKNKGVLLKNILPPVSFKNKVVRLGGKFLQKLRRNNHTLNYLFADFEKQLKQFQPHLVVVSQSINFSGLSFANACIVQQIPYVIISQKAVEFYWPQTSDRVFMSNAFLQAKKCFFVSQHNKQLTEEQFGFRFSNASIIFNPIKIPLKLIPYPGANEGYKLACIARLFIIDKGQDILLRILSQKKWKERPLKVSFIGTGIDLEGLQKMALLLNITNVEFTGHIENMETVWTNFHALVLPSRSEGLPLVVLEAMAAGRPVIVTNAGGTAEIVEEGVTGFIGEANAADFDRALERAWSCRSNWESMGAKAFEYVVTKIPKSPEADFANTLTKIVYES